MFPLPTWPSNNKGNQWGNFGRDVLIILGMIVGIATFIGIAVGFAIAALLL